MGGVVCFPQYTLWILGGTAVILLVVGEYMRRVALRKFTPELIARLEELKEKLANNDTSHLQESIWTRRYPIMEYAATEAALKSLSKPLGFGEMRIMVKVLLIILLGLFVLYAPESIRSLWLPYLEKILLFI